MRIVVDRESLLVRAPGGARMRDVARVVAEDGLELPAAPPDVTVAEWIARGAPGARARWADPVDQLVSGITLRLRPAADGSGELVQLRPVPRRSVGPDLLALAFGQGGRFAEIVQADLRVRHPGTAYEAPPFRWEDPPLEAGEERLMDAIEAALRQRAPVR